ncbi:dCTP deaminase [Aporhodopirellula aestuarii]|uniref:dCTP deaminase n=1 Tax=Aporhodopirellula aestuarii TaxID=2950107 RepID=A0ABT0U5Q9_9BACT|nr:dCTP deaminase [Aporhodopirellula aestuarii]MCM2372259.1 dCTP deaminase [Aporhodopirellula aestuarii]
MILSSQELLSRMGEDILIEPFDPSRLNANSYNLSLHDELLVYEEVVLDAASPNRYRRIEIPAEGLTLQPGVLYLGRTIEHTETNGLVPVLHSRSSLGRLGVILNPGGSLGQAGYCGTWTLELHCIQPVRIYPGMQVCQISYHELIGKCKPCDEDKYQNSTDIQPSLLHRELGYDDRDTQLELQLNFDEAIQAAR